MWLCGDEGTGLGDHSLGGAAMTGQGTSPEGLVCVHRFPSALEDDNGTGPGRANAGAEIQRRLDLPVLLVEC